MNSIGMYVFNTTMYVCMYVPIYTDMYVPICMYIVCIHYHNVCMYEAKKKRGKNCAESTSPDFFF